MQAEMRNPSFWAANTRSHCKLLPAFEPSARLHQLPSPVSRLVLATAVLLCTEHRIRVRLFRGMAVPNGRNAVCRAAAEKCARSRLACDTRTPLMYLSTALSSTARNGRAWRKHLITDAAGNSFGRRRALQQPTFMMHGLPSALALVGARIR